MNQEEIEKTASAIMNNFFDAMKDIEVEEEFISKADKCLREEGNGIETDEEFKTFFIQNAPHSKNNSILTNKQQWK